jgi:small-conductance mechanosensitive channel
MDNINYKIKNINNKIKRKAWGDVTGQVQDQVMRQVNYQGGWLQGVPVKSWDQLRDIRQQLKNQFNG